MTIKSWLKEQVEEHTEGIVCLMIIIGFIVITTSFLTQYLITLPNQACNECGYGSAIDINTQDLLREFNHVQCENKEIITYKRMREIKDKWGDTKRETGFWVNC